MTTPSATEASPVARDAAPAQAGGPPPEDVPGTPEGPLPTGRSHGSSRRATAVAFAVSALIHVLVVAFYPLLTGTGDPALPPSAESPVARPEGTRVIRLVEVADDAVEPPLPEREVEPDPVVPTPRAQAPVGPVAEPPGAAPSEAEAPGRTVAERLRPGEVDARLWTLSPSALRLDEEALAELRVRWIIEAIADSVAVAEAAARAATDWTYTDAEGRRWGISPGALHLGDITIPMPSFDAPYGSEAARRAWIDADIARGAFRGAALDNLRERIKATRERIDRERRRARGEPPDTTGHRR